MGSAATLVEGATLVENATLVEFINEWNPNKIAPGEDKTCHVAEFFSRVTNFSRLQGTVKYRLPGTCWNMFFTALIKGIETLLVALPVPPCTYVLGLFFSKATFVGQSDSAPRV